MVSITSESESAFIWLGNSGGARHESCVTSLPEINGDLKRRIETAAAGAKLPLSLAEAIGILITRSAKIARNLGRVITSEDARRLIKLSHFLRRAAGRSMASPAVLLPWVLSDKGRGDLRAGKYVGLGGRPRNSERAMQGAEGWKLDGQRRRLPRAGAKKEKEEKKRRRLFRVYLTPLSWRGLPSANSELRPFPRRVL